MERNANYALVGIASMVLFVGLVVFVFWLARLQFNQDYDVYDVLFVGPVNGLSEGGEVHFNGIKVGEVTKISLDARDPNRVIARTRVTSDVPIRENSVATLEPQGITGINFIQITAGTSSKRLLKTTVAAGEIPVIHTQRSTFSDLLQGGGTVLSAALSDVQAITAEARERKAIIADAQKALQSIDAAALEITELSRSTKGLVDGDGKRTLAELSDAATEIKAATRDARAMIGKLDGPTSEFADTGLPQLTRAITSLQATAESLDRLLGEVEQNPQGIVAKPPAKEVEVQP